MGTAFIATHECIDVNDAYKRLIVASNGEDTIVTQAYDIASGVPWPAGIGDRVRRNRFTDEWHGRNAEIVAKRAAIAEELRAAARSFDPDRTAVRYGESAGAVKSVRNAADVVHELSRDAERLLREGVTRLDSQSTTR
jgi:nitronate monooxygenase